MPSPNAKTTASSTMDISIDKTDFLKELSITQGCYRAEVNRSDLVELPVRNFREQPSDHGDRPRVEPSDFCAAKVKTPGYCTVPGRKLYDYIRLLADGEVTIKSQDNDWVQVRCGRSNTRLVGLPRKNFPNLPLYPAQGAFRLPAAIFRTMISRTIFAISQEESRYMLNGALLILQPTSITMVATDGNRLAHIQAPASISGVTGEIRVLIPKKALSEINTLLNFSGIDVFEFAKDDSTLYFRIGSRLLSCRQLVGTFPNYEPVMPRDYTRSWRCRVVNSRKRSNECRNSPTIARARFSSTCRTSSSACRHPAPRPESRRKYWTRLTVASRWLLASTQGS